MFKILLKEIYSSKLKSDVNDIVAEKSRYRKENITLTADFENIKKLYCSRPSLETALSGFGSNF